MKNLEIYPLTDNAKLLQVEFMWNLVNSVYSNSILDIFPLI